MNKKVIFLGSSLSDLQQMPQDVKDIFGHNLYLAQCGEFPSIAKPLKGIKVENVTSVTELICNFHGDTYRAVYTIEFKDTLYVLHCFQKKSKSGITTPKPDIDLIKKRLQKAIALEKEKQ
jgi:phage-related protein